MLESLASLIGGGKSPAVTAVSELPGYRYGYHTGDKWQGGFGSTEILATDYFTLRARSAQMFRTNHYARGLIRRLLTNEINTGLHLEADPLEKILGLEYDSLAEWTEAIEDRFAIWGKVPRQCDAQELRTFGQLQAAARLEALVSGDVLVVLPQYQVTGLPRVRLVPGGNVQSPLTIPRGKDIRHGVEMDNLGRQVAYWVLQPDGKTKRLPAYGEKSGRRISWLLYGTDMRYGEVRGEPLIGIILQALRDLDRYRDATLRKAVINSILAMFVTRDQAGPTKGLGTAGARVKGVDSGEDSKGVERSYNFSEYVPGLVIDKLAPGENIKAGTQGGTDQAFGEFEEAITQSIAWTFEIPPEILKLAFSNNYSASQAAINELKMYLDKSRMQFGESFCQPIYENWLISESLQGRVDRASSIVEAWRDSSMFAQYGAWVTADWTGHVKPSTDPFKLVRGLSGALDLGLTSFDRASREYSGTKFSRNVRKQKRERKLLEDAGVPVPSTDIKPPGTRPKQSQERDEDEETDDEEEA